MPEADWRRGVEKLIKTLPDRQEGRRQAQELVAEVMAELNERLDLIRLREQRDIANALQQAEFDSSSDGARRLGCEMQLDRARHRSFNRLRVLQADRWAREESGEESTGSGATGGPAAPAAVGTTASEDAPRTDDSKSAEATAEPPPDEPPAGPNPECATAPPVGESTPDFPTTEPTVATEPSPTGSGVGASAFGIASSHATAPSTIDLPIRFPTPNPRPPIPLGSGSPSSQATAPSTIDLPIRCPTPNPQPPTPISSRQEISRLGSPRPRSTHHSALPTPHPSCARHPNPGPPLDASRARLPMMFVWLSGAPPGRDVPVEGKPVRRRRGPAAVCGNGAFRFGSPKATARPTGRVGRRNAPDTHEPEDLAGTRL